MLSLIVILLSLSLYKTIIQAFLPHKLLMSSKLCKLSLVYDHEPVSILESGEPVCDSKRCSALYQPLKRLLYLLLCFCVDRRRSLVKYQYTRICQDCSRYCNSLSFSSGQPLSALPDKRVIPVRESDYKIMSVSYFSGSYYLIDRCVRSCIPYIVKYRTRKRNTSCSTTPSCDL